MLEVKFSVIFSLLKALVIAFLLIVAFFNFFLFCLAGPSSSFFFLDLLLAHGFELRLVEGGVVFSCH